jgi:hypothetical protein
MGVSAASARIAAVIAVSIGRPFDFSCSAAIGKTIDELAVRSLRTPDDRGWSPAV